MNPYKKKHIRKKKLWYWSIPVVLLVMLTILLFMRGWSDTTLFREKVALLQQEALPETIQQELGTSPSGKAGHIVFLSVSNGTARAKVWIGTGKTLDLAWKNAEKQANKVLRHSGMKPIWVKADVVQSTSTVSADDLAYALQEVESGYFRYGVAFDPSFQAALLEAELNGAGIYDYKNHNIDLEALNDYLTGAGRQTLDALPEEYHLFQCMAWICDEEQNVYQLCSNGYSYGCRQTEDGLSKEEARSLIIEGSHFLENQVQKDGSFVYGYKPCTATVNNDYNILRHAGSVWSMLCAYRLAPSDALAESIRSAIGYLKQQLLYDEAGRAYVYEQKSDEIKLGGCGLAVIALTEYMDVFQNKDYLDICESLGEGILSMFDKQTGSYYHVLNSDFSRKEEYRTVYYDGEATFALVRLYGLTGNSKWLEAAESAVNHFITADYTQYRDHWVSYSMNEITKYLPDRMEYYVFGLQNAEKNLEKIRNRETTGPTDFELLMTTFELYQRMLENNLAADSFDLATFLQTVSERVERQRVACFYPELAMYMKNPQQILSSFMARDHNFRVRIDDVQHSIGGIYLYYKNYDELTRHRAPKKPKAIA